ncbi:MAG: VWA domain-containing protein, partial [Methanoregula sp.]|nr:VWA domain-containing protein [Methanoregula sp.]
LFDRWDNRIDNKRPEPAHNITLHVNGPSPPNDCGFTDFSLVHDKKLDLDLNGEVTVRITPATKPGWHYILMDSMGSIPEQMKLFNTVANGIPFSMTQSFSPEGTPYATVLADGTSKFTFYYTLYDKYANPTRNQPVWINTSVAGEENLRTSLDNGQVWSTYGPKSFTGLFTIDATPVGNSSLKLSKVVRFYNTSPTGLDLTANPQSMPSRDANPLIYSDISAKVTDIMGNGAPGETVTFTFHDVTNTPATATVTIVPSFSSASTVLTTSAVTDSNGYATVRFYPSSYATVNEVGYLQAVTGTAKMTAAWNGNQKDEPVTWKNYPYLSAIVSVKPPQVKVGDTVDVSLKLNGDGWALYRYPVDVDLVMDRSGSMGWDINGVPGGTPTRLSIAKTAATNFIGNMGVAQDKAGLWSYSSATDVTNVAPQGAILQSPFGPVTTAVAALNANGATATRDALKESIDEMIANPNANTKAVRAVIVMTDGDWNNEGSPAAHGTGWPASNPEKTFSGSNIELNDYRYYDGLGGTLTPYTSTVTCSAYNNQICDICDHDYTAGTGVNAGKCQWTDGWNHDHLYYTPATKPASCDKVHCDVFATLNKCTDGEFTNQNLSVYAKNNNIRLYFIFFAGTPDATAKSTLETMATATGGFYQRATSAAELNDAYTRIAGDLITEAGVDTQVSVDFGQLIVNNVPATPGDEIFDYIGDPIVASPVKGVDFPTIEPGSTMVDKYNKTPNGQINKHLIPGTDIITGFPFTDIGPIIINQTTYWNTDPHKQQLAFNIGTVNVNESWETNFRLRVLKEGNILVFGPQSQVCFTNGEAGPSCMTLPNLSLSSSMNPLNVGVSETTLSIVGLSRTDDGTVKGTIPVTWTTIYNGADMITEDVSYIHDNDPPVKFDVKTLNPAFDLVTSQSATLDTEKLPPGGYKIQVRAYTKDASDTKECGPYTYSTQGRAFIKIE